jgi:hypothetical protein
MRTGLLLLLLGGCAAPTEEQTILLMIQECPGVITPQPDVKQYGA